MDLVKSAAICFLGYIQSRYALLKVRRLKHASDPQVRKLCQALEDVLVRNVLLDEVDAVQRLEDLRSQLLASDHQILFTDYGAGGPDVARTETESYSGVTSTRRLSDVAQWSKPFFWGILLLKLVRQYGSERALELGTCLGISGSYVATAQLLSGSGDLVTLEGSEALAKIAGDNFKQLGLENVSIVYGRFRDTLDAVLENEGSFDFVFIDGHHDEKATLEYYNQISPFLSEGAVLIFDDIAWSAGMKSAWRKIKSDGNFSLTADLSAIGICIVGQANKERCDIKVPLRFAGAFFKG